MTTEIITATPDTALVKTANRIKPPLKKSEILLATALAMERESKVAAEKSEKEFEEKVLALKVAVEKETRKAIKDFEIISHGRWCGSPGNYLVDLKVHIPYENVRKLVEAVNTHQRIRVTPAKEFLKRLREVDAPAGRVLAIVNDEALSAKLAKAGRALLEQALEKKTPSIEI